MLGDRQSAFVVQVVLHAVVPHTNGEQFAVDTVWQVPVPLQVRAGVAVDPVQVAATQVVPATYSRHAPAPLQVPSLPQLAAPASVH